MCRQITCPKCKKPSWAGCGAHVEQVLAHVPKSDRCTCRDAGVDAGGGGLLSSVRRLFGGTT